VWRTYQDQGLVVWGTAAPGYGSESEDAIRDFVEEMGITFPVLLDEGGEVSTSWPPPEGTPSSGAPYPQHWLVDTDGVLVWYNNAFDFGELVEVIEGELP